MIKATDLSTWNCLSPEREWVVRGWLPAGSVVSISGGDESYSAQELMTALATRPPAKQREANC